MFIGRWLLIPSICSDLVKGIPEPMIVFSITHNVSQIYSLKLQSISKGKTNSGSSLPMEHKLHVLIFQFFNWISVTIASWSSLYWNSRSFGLYVQEQALLKSSITESLRCWRYKNDFIRFCSGHTSSRFISHPYTNWAIFSLFIAMSIVNVFCGWPLLIAFISSFYADGIALTKLWYFSNDIFIQYFSWSRWNV